MDMEGVKMVEGHIFPVRHQWGGSEGPWRTPPTARIHSQHPKAATEGVSGPSQQGGEAVTPFRESAMIFPS